jgi:hypothetical protein
MNGKDKRERLARLQGKHNLSEAKIDDAIRRKEIRASAEHANRTRRKDAEPPFVILAGGEVSCVDGRPVTHVHQIAAEQFYQNELRMGGPGLIHDPAKEVFYSTEGEFALSRDHANLERLLGDKRMEAWKNEDESESE